MSHYFIAAYKVLFRLVFSGLVLAHMHCRYIHERNYIFINQETHYRTHSFFRCWKNKYDHSLHQENSERTCQTYDRRVFFYMQTELGKYKNFAEGITSVQLNKNVKGIKQIYFKFTFLSSDLFSLYFTTNRNTRVTFIQLSQFQLIVSSSNLGNVSTMSRVSISIQDKTC